MRIALDSKGTRFYPGHGRIDPNQIISLGVGEHFKGTLGRERQWRLHTFWCSSSFVFKRLSLKRWVHIPSEQEGESRAGRAPAAGSAPLPASRFRAAILSAIKLNYNLNYVLVPGQPLIYLTRHSKRSMSSLIQRPCMEPVADASGARDGRRPLQAILTEQGVSNTHLSRSATRPINAETRRPCIQDKGTGPRLKERRRGALPAGGGGAGGRQGAGGRDHERDALSIGRAVDAASIESVCFDLVRRRGPPRAAVDALTARRPPPPSS
ncbi:hypothetical protein EVAR_41524_1 [Eumeta japonica]|uniref:Uncharacterized protein n=1 Tax=Eumeta variegata TaxID=151549 RepID=A0A4C1X685_EUMVA|nr:hypothetical protein EVAR_41524_1 [Eumeta japonica]